MVVGAATTMITRVAPADGTARVAGVAQGRASQKAGRATRAGPSTPPPPVWKSTSELGGLRTVTRTLR